MSISERNRLRTRVALTLRTNILESEAQNALLFRRFALLPPGEGKKRFVYINSHINNWLSGANIMAKFNFAEVTTIGEASRLWRMNRRTLQRWCDFGYVDSMKIGGVWIISTRSMIQRRGMPDVSVRNALDKRQRLAVR